MKDDEFDILKNTSRRFQSIHKKELDLLQRIHHRMVAGGFALYMLQHLEDEGERMRNKERDIIDRAATLLARVELQSHELEEAWELEASAHTAARRVNIQQEIEIHRLTKRVEMLERQVEEMGAFVDSGEIRIDEMDPEAQRESR